MNQYPTMFLSAFEALAGLYAARASSCQLRGSKLVVRQGDYQTTIERVSSGVNWKHKLPEKQFSFFIPDARASDVVTMLLPRRDSLLTFMLSLDKELDQRILTLDKSLEVDPLVQEGNILVKGLVKETDSGPYTVSILFGGGAIIIRAIDVLTNKVVNETRRTTPPSDYPTIFTVADKPSAYRVPLRRMLLTLGR